MTTPFLGLIILPFLLIMWRNNGFTEDEPVLLEVITPVEDDIPTESWFAQFRRGMSKKGFLREQRLPVPKWYLISYVVILALDTIVFLVWITDVTIYFPWKKNILVAQMLAGSPSPDLVDLVQSWSSSWLPHLIFELINWYISTP